MILLAVGAGNNLSQSDNVLETVSFLILSRIVMVSFVDSIVSFMGKLLNLC